MKAKLTTALIAGLFASSAAIAGEYATALGKCLYNNTTAADKTTLTQWAFVTLGKTNAAKSIASIPAAKTTEVDQQTKTLVTKLITTSCSKEAAQAALKEPTTGLQDAVVTISSQMIADQLKSQAGNTFSSSMLSSEKTSQLIETGKNLKSIFKK